MLQRLDGAVAIPSFDRVALLDEGQEIVHGGGAAASVVRGEAFAAAVPNITSPVALSDPPVALALKGLTVNLFSSATTQPVEVRLFPKHRRDAAVLE